MTSSGPASLREWRRGGRPPLGFDPSQPGVRALVLKARADAEPEVEIEITKGLPFVRPVGRWCGPGERVIVPKSHADALGERGFARRLPGPS